MLDQQRQVVEPLGKRGQLDAHCVEAVHQVAAEAAGLNLDRQIAVGRGDQAEVDAQDLLAPEAPQLAGLEHAQELGLQVERELPDLVEEQRAPVRALEQPRPIVLGAGEGALGVAEQLRFHDRGGQGGAVLGDEGAVVAA